MMEYIIGISIPILFAAGGFLYKKNKSSKDDYSYVYIPQGKPRLNTREKKPVDNFPTTRFIRFYDDDPLKNTKEASLIDGFHAFRISLIKFLINERWRAPEYKSDSGVSYDINKALNFEEFYNMSNTVYDEIMENFGEYISTIHSIKNLNDESGINIEMTINGLANIQYIFIPNIYTK